MVIWVLLVWVLLEKPIDSASYCTQVLLVCQERPKLLVHLEDALLELKDESSDRPKVEMI